MKKRDIQLPVLVFALLQSCGANANFFDDQLNLNGMFRTDYVSMTEGSQENPLELDREACYYGQPEHGTELFIEVHESEACPAGPVVYEAGPFYHSNLEPGVESFWVLSANVETYAFSGLPESAPLGELQGPPNLSTSLTGDPGLLKFHMIEKPQLPFNIQNGFEAHLIIDNEGPGEAPKFEWAVPFLGLGAQQGWGNGGPVGHINLPGAPATTAWTSQLNIANAGTSQAAMSYNVVANAEWGGKRRSIQVLIFHHNIETSTDFEAGTHRHWNWPAKNSVWFPGADIAFIDAEDIEVHCGPGVGSVPRISHLGETYRYWLDWDFLFRCLSDRGLFDDPMPDGQPIPLLGVHWAVELYGNASIWAIVSDMEMLL